MLGERRRSEKNMWGDVVDPVVGQSHKTIASSSHRHPECHPRMTTFFGGSANMCGLRYDPLLPHGALARLKQVTIMQSSVKPMPSDPTSAPEPESKAA